MRALGYDVSGAGVELGMRMVLEVWGTKACALACRRLAAWNALRLFTYTSMLACAYKQAFVEVFSGIPWGSVRPAIENYLYLRDFLYIVSLLHA